MTIHRRLGVAGVLALISLSAVFARDLSFDDRVRAQEAIERVAYAHWIGASAPFEQAVPRSVLERKVRNYLAQSAALATIWNAPITADMLRAELARMTRGTRMPERILQYYEALGRDAFLLEECLARPALADRLSRSRFSADASLHGSDPSTGETASQKSWDEWWRDRSPSFDIHSVHAVSTGVGIAPLPGPARSAFDPTRIEESLACPADNTWDQGLFAAVPLEQLRSSVWTGTEVLAWTGNIGGARYDPVTDEWRAISLVGAPSTRGSFTSVWTGTHMIIWGGQFSTILNSGGRYDPVSDTWSPTQISGAPSGRWHHSAVWTGRHMLIWGGDIDFQGNETNTGARYHPDTNSWSPMTLTNAPTSRAFHNALWTGTHMLVWGGGQNVGAFNDGASYDPDTDSWSTISNTGAPSVRSDFTAIWTGTRMIVWGGTGVGSGGYLNTGATYDPIADTWTPTAVSDAPMGRGVHAAAWTGQQMLVWGGVNFNGDLLVTGGRYDPVADAWTAMTTEDASPPRDHNVGYIAVWTGARLLIAGGDDPAAMLYDPVHDRWDTSAVPEISVRRSGPTAVWTGNEMLVFGGVAGNNEPQHGSRYDPALDLWTPMTQLAAPSPRAAHTAVWTGARMLVWGGRPGPAPTPGTNTGSRYDPAADTWQATTTVMAPQQRHSHTAVWTGSRMIVWGGVDGSTYFGTGGVYDPVQDAWSSTSGANAPAPRIGHGAVWTGGRMFVWGGILADGNGVQTGARYDPSTDSWAPTNLVGAPSARLAATAVWTGSTVIVWGGTDSASVLLNTGGRYDPSDDSWTATTTVNAPSARRGHSAVWTGDRMMVWGGSDTTFRNTGALYNPAADSWVPTSLTAAPSPRRFHSAVWTGSMAIIWGGQDASGALSGGGRYNRGAGADGDGDGFSECAGDCNDGNAANYPGASELCDGFDNDCNGAVDESFDTPDSIAGLVFLDRQSLAWEPDPVADGYDAARGDLAALRAADGDFTAALASCLSDDGAATTVEDATDPSSGAAYFYLVRGQNACKKGSYGTASAHQVEDRDRTLVACP